MNEAEVVFNLRVDTNDSLSDLVQVTLRGDRKIVRDVVDTLCFGVHSLAVDEYPIDVGD